MMMAKANAIPNAARLTTGASSLAMMAARYGPSTDIMTHVPARGSQRVRMFRYVRGVLCTALGLEYQRLNEIGSQKTLDRPERSDI